MAYYIGEEVSKLKGINSENCLSTIVWLGSKGKTKTTLGQNPKYRKPGVANLFSVKSNLDNYNITCKPYKIINLTLAYSVW